MKNMHKIALLALMASSVGLSACACQLTIINNTPFKARILNNVTKKATNIFSWGDAKIDKKKERTDITVSVFTLYGAKQKNYHLKQIACAENNKIKLYVQGIMDGNLGENKKLFKMTTSPNKPNKENKVRR